MSISARPLRLPDDYEAIASLLGMYWAEPTSADRLREDDAKLFETGSTYMDENGLLAGYDRLRTAVVAADDAMIGYVWIWRAPWTEPGYLNMTLVAHRAHRKRGVGTLLLRHAADWAESLGAAAIMTEVWDDDADSLDFARGKGFAVERHSFQSVLKLEGAEIGLSFSPENPLRKHALDGADAPERLEREGLRFTTLAEEPGEASERKLYDLYKATLPDIPGYKGEVPDIGEWRKWYLQADGYAPELVLIAAAGDEFVGVSNMLHNSRSNGMYHEYTGVARTCRGRGVGLALKVKAIGLALSRGAAYLRTDNDSANGPMLAINRRLGYEPLRGMYRIEAKLADMRRRLAEGS